MNVEIGTEAGAIPFLGILYLFQIFGIVSLQCKFAKNKLTSLPAQSRTLKMVVLNTANNFIYVFLKKISYINEIFSKQNYNVLLELCYSVEKYSTRCCHSALSIGNSIFLTEL